MTLPSIERGRSLPHRTPYYCSGCPHSTGTKAPEDAFVGAGIGCHGLVGLMEPKRVGNVMGNTQMGGEGVQWVGIEPFVDVDHFIQNLGDGTFAHSGSLASARPSPPKAHMTYKMLYNGAVAMTGGQDAAGRHAGRQAGDVGAVRGRQSRDHHHRRHGQVQRASTLRAGVEVWDRARIIEAQELLAKVPGVTLLIHDQQCAAEKRRDRKRGLVADPAQRVVINERVCEGCGDCGAQSNCLSVQPIDTEFGRKTQIHQSSCNKDYSCLDGDCPSFLTVMPKTRSATQGRRARPRAVHVARRRFDAAATCPSPTLDRSRRRRHHAHARHRRDRRGHRGADPRHRGHARRQARRRPRPDRPVAEGRPGRVRPAHLHDADRGHEQAHRRLGRPVPRVRPPRRPVAGQPGRRLARAHGRRGVDVEDADRA